MDTAASHAGVSDGKRDDPDEMSGNAACGDGVPPDDWRSNYGRQGSVPTLRPALLYEDRPDFVGPSHSRCVTRAALVERDVPSSNNKDHPASIVFRDGALNRYSTPIDQPPHREHASPRVGTSAVLAVVVRWPSDSLTRATRPRDRVDRASSSRPDLCRVAARENRDCGVDVG